MKHKILIVEDDEIMLEINSEILKSAGYECAIARDGFKAIDVIATDTFDVITTDIAHNPGPNGLEFLKKKQGTRSRCSRDNSLRLSGHCNFR